MRRSGRWKRKRRKEALLPSIFPLFLKKERKREGRGNFFGFSKGKPFLAYEFFFSVEMQCWTIRFSSFYELDKQLQEFHRRNLSLSMLITQSYPFPPRFFLSRRIRKRGVMPDNWKSLAYTHTHREAEREKVAWKKPKKLFVCVSAPALPRKKSWLFSKFSPAFGVRAQTLPSLIGTNCSFLPHLSPFFRYPNVILMSIQTVIPIKTSSCFHSPPFMLWMFRHLRTQFLEFRKFPNFPKINAHPFQHTLIFPFTFMGCSCGARRRSLFLHRSMRVKRPVLPVAWAKAYTTSWKTNEKKQYL